MMLRQDPDTPAKVSSYGRRRAAALRLAPFGEGPSDPIDSLAQLPIRRPEPCHGVEFSQGGGWRPCCCRERTA